MSGVSYPVTAVALERKSLSLGVSGELTFWEENQIPLEVVQTHFNEKIEHLHMSLTTDERQNDCQWKANAKNNPSNKVEEHHCAMWSL